MLKVFQNLPSREGIYSAAEEDLGLARGAHQIQRGRMDLPALEKEVSTADGESESMAKSFGRTKAFVPSRSHLSAGEPRLFETVVEVFTAPFDHVADHFRKFLDETLLPSSSNK